MSSILRVRDLTKRFGGIIAIKNATFDVKARSITALIGPNGAGKTTVFNCVTGFYKPTAGSMNLVRESDEIDLGNLAGSAGNWSIRHFFAGTHHIARAGVARTFQNIRLFKEMTAIENMLVAQYMTMKRGIGSALLRTPAFCRSESEAVARAFHWLDVVGLRQDANRIAGELPYGHQRRLEIARAMCTSPRLICLDEPAAGLNSRESAELARLLSRFPQEYNVAVLLIEHDMNVVMGISRHVIVMDHGEVIAQGTPLEIRNDPQVLSAYLGAADAQIKVA